MLAALVTAQSGPAVDPTMPNTNATVYSASTTCSTVPKTAQAVPSMTDFLAGLQVSLPVHPKDLQRPSAKTQSSLMILQ